MICSKKKKTIREAKDINKHGDRSQMKMTGYKEKCTIFGFTEDGPQEDEYKIAVLRLVKNMFLGTVIKMRYWLPQNERQTDASLVEYDRITGRKLSLVIKREATVRKACQLTIYFGLFFKGIRLYHIYIL